jgi:tetratricopeptide (TPR) repeat protein
MMSQPALSQDGRSLVGVRVAVHGKLIGMSRRELAELVRAQGGIALQKADATANLLVVGDEHRCASALGANNLSTIDADTREAIQSGQVQVMGETELWRRLGLIESDQDIQRLYTPAMLAELLKVKVAVIRRWQRRGLIRPVREVRKLPYFDFEQVVIARRLAELLASGISPAALEKRLAEWGRRSPADQPSLPGLAVVARGRHVLLRDGDELVEANGQRWFSFVAQADKYGAVRTAGEPNEHGHILSIDRRESGTSACPPPAALVEMAEDLEDDGQLAGAADMYRAALAAGGTNAEVCFALAEVLYRLGDLTAARERYFMAIELDESYVEARANLGCLLAEQGELEMAVAAFEGALRHHADYADAHYHLARVLHDLDRPGEAVAHWRAFLRLAPESPWAAEARFLLMSAKLDDTGDVD